MTPPDSNLDKQKKRHRGPLWGIAAVLILVALLFFGYLTYITGADPEEPPVEEEVLPDEDGIPAEGAPATPLEDEDSAPQVIEEDTEPDD